MNKIKYKIIRYLEEKCASFLHSRFGYHVIDATRLAHVDPEKYPFCVVCKKPYNSIIEKSHTLAWFYAENVGKKLV